MILARTSKAITTANYHLTLWTQEILRVENNIGKSKSEQQDCQYGPGMLFLNQ